MRALPVRGLELAWVAAWAADSDFDFLAMDGSGRAREKRMVSKLYDGLPRRGRDESEGLLRGEWSSVSTPAM